MDKKLGRLEKIDDLRGAVWETEGQFENGREIGKWTYFNSDGSVKEIKEY